jgi:hypothetical protein
VLRGGFESKLRSGSESGSGVLCAEDAGVHEGHAMRAVY